MVARKPTQQRTLEEMGGNQITGMVKYHHFKMMNFYERCAGSNSRRTGIATTVAGASASQLHLLPAAVLFPVGREHFSGERGHGSGQPCSSQRGCAFEA